MPSPLRIISYNIRCNTPVDEENAWPSRRDRVASVLKLYRPDLLGLQEVQQGQVDDLSAALPDYAWLGVGRDDGQQEGEYVPIFYQPSRLDLIDSGHFWLSEMPDVAGSLGWDAVCIRVTTWARFVDKETGETLVHLNTHLDHRGMKAQLEGARLLRQFLATEAKGAPTIVTGDFNCTADSATYAALTTDASTDSPTLLDAMDVSQSPHHGPSKTFNSRFLDPLQAKIDYIFCHSRSQVQVQRHAILADNWDGLYPSDHLPVLADVAIRNDGLE